MMPPPPRRFVEDDPGPVTEPVVRSSTFEASTAADLANRFEEGDGHVYSRVSNPTVDALEAEVADMEGAEAAAATSSGMGAIHVTLMALLEPGARVVVDPCTYGCTYSLLERLASWGVEVVPCDTADEQDLASTLEAGADVLFVETPMNPTLRCVDLEGGGDLSEAADARLVVDNTFATPASQRPLDHGADVVVHSLTKAVNGHSDVLAGAVVGPADVIEDVEGWRKDAGPVLDPETAWLVLRGAETLPLRVEHAQRTALELARDLEARGHRVRHPHLASHPDVELARRQMDGCLVFTLDAGDARRARRLVDGLDTFRGAVSLGGVESLVCHPASTTHAPMDDAARREAGILDGLVRFSVGVEPADELGADLAGALEDVEPPAAATA